MKVRKPISTRLLVFCGALVFLIASSYEAKSASANHERRAVELTTADDAEDVLAELKGILEEIEMEIEGATDLFLPNEETGDEKQFEPYILTINLCQFYNIVGRLARDNPELASRLAEVLFKLLREPETQKQFDFQTEQEDGSKDSDQPSWYYHFSGKNHSYIRVRYGGNAYNIRNVSGEIWFTAGKYTRQFPVVWSNRANNYQTFYFSCYINFSSLKQFEPEIQPILAYVMLAILGAYWRSYDITSYDALTTFDKHSFCEDWFCKDIMGGDESCVSICRGLLWLSDKNLMYGALNKGWEGDWPESPLLNVTPFRSEWDEQKHVEYFDNISFHVTNNVDVELTELHVVLNNQVIAFCPSMWYVSDGQMIVCEEPGIIRYGQPLELANLTENIRKNEVVEKIIQEGGSINEMTKLLEEAAKNIGQSWDYKYGNYWGKKYWQEGEIEKWAWYPTPDVYCSEYACWMIDGYGDIEDWIWGCKGIDVSTMWARFLRVDENNNGCADVVSPHIPFFYYEHGCMDDWGNLASNVKPGYYVGMSRKDKGEKSVHSTFFIKWDKDYPPRNGVCYARFHAIGGNQGDGGKVTVTRYIICNVLEEDCLKRCEDFAEQQGSKVRVFWGEPYNFFGIIRKK